MKKWFDNLLEFNLTRPYPFGRWFNILSLLLGTAMMAFFFVWATATAGYEPVSTISSQYDLVDDHWYTRFVAGSRNLCEKAVVSVGDTVFTKVGLVPWRVLTIRDREKQAYVGSIQYSGTDLENCVFDSTIVHLDMVNTNTELSIFVNCSTGDWDGRFMTSIKGPLNQALVEQQLMVSGFTDGKELGVGLNAVVDIILLLHDALRGLFASNGATSDPYSFYTLWLYDEHFCNGNPVHSDSLKNCSRDVNPAEPKSSAQYQNLSDRLSMLFGQPVPQAAEIPIANVVSMAISLAFWDMGSASDYSLISNYSNRASILQTCDVCESTNDILARQPGQIWYNRTILPLDAQWTPPNATKLDVQYLCNIKQLKKPAAFVLAILVAGLALFGSFWKAYLTAATMYGKNFARPSYQDAFREHPAPVYASALPYDPKDSTPPANWVPPAVSPYPNTQQGYQPQHQQGMAPYPVQQAGYAPVPATYQTTGP